MCLMWCGLVWGAFVHCVCTACMCGKSRQNGNPLKTTNQNEASAEKKKLMVVLLPIVCAPFRWYT